MKDTQSRNELFRTLPVVEAGVAVAAFAAVAMLVLALLNGPETHVENVVDAIADDVKRSR